MKLLFSFLTYLLLFCYLLGAGLEIARGEYILFNSAKLVLLLFTFLTLIFPVFFKRSVAITIIALGGLATLPISEVLNSNTGVLFVDSLEHALLLTLPFIVYLLKSNNLNPSRGLNIVRIAFGITFIGHAIYSSGLIVEPTQFIFILSTLFPESETLNQILLYLIFVSDLIVGIGLIVRFSEWNFLLYYTLGWVLIATTARALVFFPQEINTFELLSFFSKMPWRIIYILVPWFFIKKNRTI